MSTCSVMPSRYCSFCNLKCAIGQRERFFRSFLVAKRSSRGPDIFGFLSVGLSLSLIPEFRSKFCRTLETSGRPAICFQHSLGSPALTGSLNFKRSSDELLVNTRFKSLESRAIEIASKAQSVQLSSQDAFQANKCRMLQDNKQFARTHRHCLPNNDHLNDLGVRSIAMTLSDDPV